MLRNVSLEDISDGRLYTENDLVRVDTNSCKGCQTVCCQNMGSTIVIDPYDCYKLTTGLGKTFEQLTMNELELNVEDTGRMRRILNILCRRASVIRIIYPRLN